jgi:hypothetical protein
MEALKRRWDRFSPRARAWLIIAGLFVVALGIAVALNALGVPRSPKFSQ